MLVARTAGDGSVRVELHGLAEPRAAEALVRAAAERLAPARLTVEVGARDVELRSLYEAVGFVADTVVLAADAGALGPVAPSGPTYGSIHVQTDDLDAVERAVRQFVPRLPGGSRGSVVAPPENGWTAVYDELCDRDPEMLRRLARELSDRSGAVSVALGVEEGAVVRYVLFERGRIVDEYVSVPTYHGPLPPGDVIALEANPTVVARLTGADPARVRAVARTAERAGELPPPQEHVREVAVLLGVPRGAHGYAAAAGFPGGVVIPRP
jgi:hypothetical protein